ncbi:hypothetical protein ACTXT7_003825 [Hymenolepis weldensis]
MGSEESMKYEDLSSLIYPPLSLINHSCDPSALIHITSEGVAFLMPIRELKAGNEITISYQVAYEEKIPRIAKDVKTVKTTEITKTLWRRSSVRAVNLGQS